MRRKKSATQEKRPIGKPQTAKVKPEAKKPTETAKPHVGRPRSTFPVFESMPQASAAIGWPILALKAAKDAGSKAFLSGGRIDIELLLPDLAKVAFKDLVILDASQESAKLAAAKREEIEDATKIRRGEMHILADVEAKVWSDCLAPTRDMLLNLGRICGPQCNPENPALATKVLNDHVQQHLANIAASQPNEAA